MKSKVTTAVILAAGLGARLKHHTQDQPKGFLEIDGRSLIERSITILVQKGITEIIIGTGYLNEHFDSLKQKFPVTTFQNEDYSTTGSMYTLYVLQHLIKEQFLLLESDLLYDPVAVDYLMDDIREDIILASGATRSGDEVYIQSSPEGTLQQMSKDRNLLSHIDGELVGISKLSLDTLRRMVSFSKIHFKEGNRMLNYEDALVGAATKHPIHIMVIQDLVWCEIDDENHLQRALTLIYPKIVQRIEKYD
jgi:2-aminoethylphosphonate-pyruvate transaminase